jgi:predicted dehydrogenase
MKKAAIVGLGDIAPCHVGAMTGNENIQLVAACDIDPARRAIAPGVPFYTDLEEMLRKARPDCVHICLPHHLHYPAAQTVAAAGCNIFAEKPLALNAAQGLEFVKLEEDYGIRACICFQNRRNPTTEALLAELRGGACGKVVGVYGNVAWRRTRAYYTARPWRGEFAQSGGGCMINQAIHTIDLIQYLAGAPVVSVRGTTARLLDYGLDVEDTAAAVLEFQNGAKGFFTASVANYEDQGVTLTVQCEGAAFRMANGMLYREGVAAPLAQDDAPAVGKRVYGNSHGKLIAEFYEVLETGAGAYITPRDALASLRIIDAVRESSRKGQGVLMN